MLRRAAVLPALLLALPGRADTTVLVPADRVFPPAVAAAAATLDEPLPALIGAWRARTGKRTFRKRIVVHKARRRMDLYADGERLKSYVINLGLAPVGDKRAQGDRRTPEGDLYICSRNRGSQFTRFLGLSYPTPEAAAAGVAAGRVKPEVERAVREAHRTGTRCPPQRTALGGAVGIHGRGEWERRAEGFVVHDWTWGCVGLRDVDVLELFDHYAEVGVPVRIEAD
jgi:hypothetical protein